MSLVYGEAICRDLVEASRREWLETNELGGYASSTLCGINTRRYHGLLVAATKPPVGRSVLLSKLEETVTVRGQRFELSVNQYPGAVHPQGYLLLKQFRLDPFPVFLYEAGGAQLEKAIFMPPGENTTVIRYTLRAAPDACMLELRPLIAIRDYHATMHENGALDPTLHVETGSVRMAPYQGLPSLYLAHGSDDVQQSAEWYRNFEYQRERERGLDFREDLYHPCTLTKTLKPDESLTVIASTEPHDVEAADRLLAARQMNAGSAQPLAYARGSVSGVDLNAASGDRTFTSMLTRAAGQFLVRRGEWNTVIAGYHWFSDWGRDTMIALPGLTLATGRPDAARGILRAFAGAVNQGMLPNRFPDSGEAPEYNTVDGTLWFFEAARAYLEHTGDLAFIRANLYDVFADIVAWHERGTRYGIRMDSDGLIVAGAPGVQLTWMDAKVGDWVVTPRLGKPVEIQALWHNALRVMEDLAQRLEHAADSARYRQMADRASASFTPLFWNDSAGCLYDVVNGADRNSSIRPNQIFAVSLPYSMLTPGLAARVVDTVERHLLTPFGLRTLAPGDPQYRGRFEGDPYSRDGAYHQGTVWPWLMGPFLKAYLATHGRSAEARAQAIKWLAELRSYIEDLGVGQVCEVFDGDAPQRPGGCIAQAWSVAELLRVCVEDLHCN